MKSLSEIDTVSKRASRAAGFDWGVAEEVGKNMRMLEMLGLPGIKNLNYYYKINIFRNESNNLDEYRCYRMNKIKSYKKNITIINKLELKKVLNELQELDNKTNIEPFLNKLKIVFILLVSFNFYNTFYPL